MILRLFNFFDFFAPWRLNSAMYYVAPSRKKTQLVELHRLVERKTQKSPYINMLTFDLGQPEVRGHRTIAYVTRGGWTNIIAIDMLVLSLSVWPAIGNTQTD